MTPSATALLMNSFGLALNTPNVAAQCRGCLDRAGSARYRPTGRP
jgi:hypothetical protein